MREDDIPGRIGELIRYGTVETVDLAAARVTVRIGDIVTQPLRWITGAAGGTRIWSPPKAGEQIALLAPEGDLAGAIALRGVVCDAFPPAGATLRELVAFQDGAVLAYDPEAHVLDVTLPDGATLNILSGAVTLTAPDGIAIEGDVAIAGDVTIDGELTASGDVKAGDISLRQHKHGGVQSGGSKTGLPE